MNKVFLNGQAILKLPAVCLYADSIHTEKEDFEGLLYSIKYNLDIGDKDFRALYNFLVDAINIENGKIQFEEIDVYTNFSRANAEYGINLLTKEKKDEEKEALKKQLVEAYEKLLQRCNENGWHPIIELSERELEISNKKTLITEIPILIPSPSTTYKAILKFKEKRRDELLRFRKYTYNFQDEIKSADSREHVLDLMHKYRNDLELGLLDLKRLTGESRIETAISSVGTLLKAKNPALISSFISSNAVLGGIAGNSINAPMIGTILGGFLGVGTTIAGAYLTAREKLKSSSFAYVFHARKKKILDQNGSLIDWQINEKEKNASKTNFIIASKIDAKFKKEEREEKKKKELRDKLQQLGDYHAMLGKNTAAIEVYSDLIILKPDDSVYYKRRGYLYAINKQLKKALSDLDKSVSINDSDAEVYNYRSAVKILLNENESAVEDILKAINLNPIILNVLTIQQQKLLEKYIENKNSVE